MPLANGEGWRSPFLTQYCPVFANVEDGVFHSNIRAAVQRDLPWLQGKPAHDGVAVIVGGGPSLAESVEHIRQLKDAGCCVVAVNNTAAYLRDRGIMADRHVLLDARPSNARFVIEGPEYYIASQCAPEIFDAASNVTLWHPHVEGVQQIIGSRETALIGGGTTVGLQSIALMYANGFRVFHLFGFDSSYRSAEGHAYPQPENESDEIIEVELNTRRFLCARWMAHQADEFKNIACQLTDCEIAVYGTGLLPYMAKLLFDPLIKDAACYDMAEAPASWDFLIWLVNAKMAATRRGVTTPLRVAILPGPKDGFRDDGLPVNADGRRQLLENVMRPAIEMIGAVEDASAVNAYRHRYVLREIVDASEAVPKFHAPAHAQEQVQEWLKTKGLQPGGYLTVTLREAEHWPQRNSDTKAWLEFAAWCGVPVVFVRDTAKADEPIGGLSFPEAATDIHIRTALYSTARCNLLVANGPVSLCFFSDAPFLMFKPLVEGYSPGTPEYWAEAIGVPVGTQLPWATPRQRIVWATDSFEDIKAAWLDFIAIPQTEGNSNE